MGMPHYDAIVVGASGGVGSAALYHAARRGLRVLGLDRFSPGHDRGSSHGETRIIREAYFEHPDYVPLVRHSYALWRALEELRGRELLTTTGLLEIGPPLGEIVAGVRASAQKHAIVIEDIPAGDVEQRFPGFRLPEGCEAVFEPTAGYLRVEQCVIAHAEEAVHLGAELITGESINSWRAEGTGVLVQTDAQVYSADRLILAAGAWAPQLLRELEIPLVVRRKPLYWYAPHGDHYRADRGCPAFLFELPAGIFYGLAQIDVQGVKLAEHTGGTIVADPLTVDRELDAADESRVSQFAAHYLPNLSRRLITHATCLYTLTADHNFVVDRHPLFPQIAFATGLSGHGFKFTPALGQALVELAVDGQSTLPIEFLNCQRAALRPLVN